MGKQEEENSGEENLKITKRISGFDPAELSFKDITLTSHT